MKNQNAPTMKDVAKKAGVSLGTVSKVINNIPVGPSYRLKVEQAIKELNYEVNTYARGLKTNRTNIIALIIPDNINPFFSGLAHYIEAALYQRKYKLMLCCSDGIREKEIEYLNLCSQNKVDGIIALTYSDIGNYVSKSIPLVSFDRHFDNNFTPMVSSDNYMGGVIATEKLIELGCKRPAFIRFSSSIPGEADKRKDGYFDTCKKYNIPPIVLDKNVFAQVDKELEDFICEHEHSDHTLDFDGIFSNTDLHAFKAKKILEEKGYRIPEDVQIIGFDGIRQFGEEELFVSSICQPIKELAETCVSILLSNEQETRPTLTLLPVKYEFGGTTKREKEN
ncbi:MAG: LacI family DNA-binding transcriptional regulator [Firmicutes bacterium]|uniref:LacI family DNA-binding transcriptional regulator n=1 Tax=Candidatus Scybalomonas excrementavium TaxID=2840943 RepID=A0A9D9N6W3_9FIRM|nr:LacI family DNA-binding transcriptional regulator [Candidatus Scybalomonas excrementavium]